MTESRLSAADFHLGSGSYLLNHSVGRPLKSAEAAFHRDYFEPWQQQGEAIWPHWLQAIDGFRAALARLFSVSAEGFCPQSNLSSGLTKLVMALPELARAGGKVLLSEQDFPTIGYVLQHALPGGRDQIRYIPVSADVTDPDVWADAMTAEIRLVFVSHAYSNTGQQAPLAEILPLARSRGILSLVDVAQSAGILPLDLSRQAPDFVLGSCVKWLCGGPGAGYLWLSEARIAECEPKDVGWFSHAQPFEMDIHDFRYHPGANRFWGGTPSVAPYAIAAHSVARLVEHGIDVIRAHNLALQRQVIDALGERVVSPRTEAQRNGSLILHVGARQTQLAPALAAAGIAIDERASGVRVSPHLYNSAEQMAQLVEVVEGIG
ncbi:aminotransferase class V-fold PLP-dependent enzyme [Ferrimonas gelatinilytica]|uniref:Aminotransferase class V-fold PLP-dependent enzyme n=1 Tax=Ferrimonas gelatinilytica TaxID=1255257 RepID=A0ABP9SGM4_9GAMM